MKKQIKMAFKVIEDICGRRLSEILEEHFTYEDLDALLAVEKKLQVIKECGRADHFKNYIQFRKDDIEWLVDFSVILTYYVKFAQMKKKPLNEPLKGFNFKLGGFKAHIPKTNIEVFEALFSKDREEEAYKYVPEDKGSDYLFVTLKCEGWQKTMYFIFHERGDCITLEEAFKWGDALQPFEYHIAGALEAAIAKHLGVALVSERQGSFDAIAKLREFEGMLG